MYSQHESRGARGPATLLERIKAVDFFPKTPSDVTDERTKVGGVFTIICVLILFYLVFSELASYMQTSTTDLLTVDVRRGEILPIHMDVLFPSLSCLDVGLDVVDGISGNTIHSAAHQIIMQRLDDKGNALMEGEAVVGKNEIQAKGAEKECLPCIAADKSKKFYMAGKGRVLGNQETGCCKTCDEVRKFCQERGIAQRVADETPQCKVVAQWADNEGCRVYGYLEVPRGKGDFHIAAGKGFAQSHDDHEHHMHQINWERLNKFNITHHITSLTFGPVIPDMVNPLDDHKVASKGLAQHMYFIQVVPTTYSRGDVELRTNQYSFTQHHQPVVMNSQSFSLPGVYFKYDISPMMIHIEENPGSFADFIVRLCAIIGGMYVVFGIFYSVSSNVVKQTKKKK